jgi:colicin import membrane protein
MDGQLEQVQGVLTEFSRVEAGLAALREKHGNTIYEVTTTAGMDAAKAARAEIREPRFAVEKVRKAAKAPLLELGRRIDAEAIRITDAILAIEEPIDDQIKAEEARKAAEKEAKRAAEVERLRLEAAAKLKAEEERLAAERAEIARQQAAVAAERAKAEAEAAAERKKIEAEAAAARRKAEAEAAEAKREAELELAAQRKAIAQQRSQAEAEARRVADEQAAEAKRLADAQAAVEAQQWALERERQKAREEAERNAAEEQASFIARECPEDQPADDQGDELAAAAVAPIPPYFQLVVAVADAFSVPHEVADGWIKHYQHAAN